MKIILVALACLGASVVIATLGLFVIAFTAGPSIAAGERAALMAGGLDLLLWLGASVTFWSLSRSMPLMARTLSTLAFGAVAFLALGCVFVATVVLLNR